MFQGCFKEVLRLLQGRMRGVPRDQGSFKGIQRKCQVRFEKISIKSVNGVSRIIQGSFVLQFCSWMDLIAAT